MKNCSFGECPVCRQGLLVAVKNSENGQLLLMCDDCESQWRSPEEAKSFKNALSDEVHGVGPATVDDIKAAGWMSSAIATAPDE
jgi:Zn-finger protein